MNKDVIIKVKGIQGGVASDDAIEMITTGQYFEKKGKSYIKYEDTSLEEAQVTSTTIKIDQNQVSILRFGAANTQMIFEKNQEHFSPYETPFGLFEIMLRTKEVILTKEENTLSLIVDYTIDINHTGETESRFVVEVANQGE